MEKFNCGVMTERTACEKWQSPEASVLYTFSENNIFAPKAASPEKQSLERLMAGLDKGTGAFAAASGEELWGRLLQTLCEPGTNVILSTNIYAGLREPLAAQLKAQGIAVKAIEGDHPCQIEQNVDDLTRAIIAPSIGTMTNVAPLEAMSRIARRQCVPLIVENSFATAALCRPVEWGAQLVVYSSMKFVSGFDGYGAALVEGSFEWQKYPEKFPKLSAKAKSAGAALLTELLHEESAATLSTTLPRCEAARIRDSLATLSLRMECRSKNALAAAKLLEESKEASFLHYPGLASHKQNDMAQVYLKEGAGPMVVFSLKSPEKNRAFAEALKLPESAVLTLACTAQCAAENTDLQSAEPPAIMRLILGLENEESLLKALSEALAAAK